MASSFEEVKNAVFPLPGVCLRPRACTLLLKGNLGWIIEDWGGKCSDVLCHATWPLSSRERKASSSNFACLPTQRTLALIQPQRYPGEQGLSQQDDGCSQVNRSANNRMSVKDQLLFLPEMWLLNVYCVVFWDTRESLRNGWEGTAGHHWLSQLRISTLYESW